MAVAGAAAINPHNNKAAGNVLIKIFFFNTLLILVTSFLFYLAGTTHSVIQGAMLDPKPQDLDLLIVKWLPLVRGPPLHQHIEYAVPAVPGDDHGTIDSTLHQFFIGRHGQSGLQVARPRRRGMALDAVCLQDGLHIALKTDLPFPPDTAAD